MSPITVVPHIDPVQFSIVAGLIATTALSFIKRDRWPSEVNVALAILLSIILGTAEMFVNGKYTNGTLMTDIILTVGATQAWFAIFLIKAKAEGYTKETTDLPITTTP